MRLQRPKTYRHELSLGTALAAPPGLDFGELPLNPSPEVDYSTTRPIRHLSKEILSYFPKAKTADSLVLDLGCGTAPHREACEHAGFDYIGLDYSTDGAPILGDAHALPLRDESVEFVLSIATLEHLRFPFVAMKEAHRVLKAGGLLIGTVAFLEPFHDDSYYHHTHLGTINSLLEGGFEIQQVCSSGEWSVLKAQANMALFPKMPKRLSRSIVLPTQIVHEAWWKLAGIVARNDRLDVIRRMKTTGAFTFIARK